VSRARRKSPIFTLAAVSLALLAACGGDGDDDGEDDGAGETVEASDAATAGSENAGAASESDAVDGVLVSVLSPDLGLYAVDRDTGEHSALSLDAVEFIERDRQPIAATSTAFTLSLTTLEGQSFSHEVGLVRVDLDTGEATQIAGLGIDRESDQSDELTRWKVLDADDETVWVETGAFFDVEGRSIIGFDAATGAQIVELDALDFEVTTDTGSICSGTSDGLLVMPDGALITTTSGWPAVLDPVTGEVSMILEWCGFGTETTLAEFVDPADADEWFVTEDGPAVSAEAAEQALGFVPLRMTPTPGRGLVEGDGSLWWLFDSATSVETGDISVSAHAGGIVRFDPVAGEVAAVWPLGDASATYLDGDDDITTVSTMSSFDLRYIDGALWIMDHREDAPLRRLDPATGAITEIAIEKGEGIDLTAAEMIFSDPEAIWLEVSRKVITSDDENGRSTSGTSFLERVDTATGTITLSIPIADILGF
jgi:hypothetical protein